MRVELVPGMANVVRFPVERRARPTLALMREIAPDVREVLNVAEAFGLDMPAHDLRDRVDAETARYIVEQFGGVGALPHAVLDELLRPVLARAVAASRTAHDLSADAAEARQRLSRARTAGHFWIEPLRERVETAMLRTAEALIEAHARVEEAEGVARAVDLARRGEIWAARDHDAEDAALIKLAPRRAG